MTDIYKLVEAFGRGLSSGLFTPEARKDPPPARTPRLPKRKELPGQLPLFPPDASPGPLPTSLQVNVENLAESIAPGAGYDGGGPIAPPLSQHDIERIEAILEGRTAPDTYVPDNVNMEQKTGAG